MNLKSTAKDTDAWPSDVYMIFCAHLKALVNIVVERFKKNLNCAGLPV